MDKGAKRVVYEDKVIIRISKKLNDEL